MITLTKTSPKTEIKAQQLDTNNSPCLLPPYFLQAVIEGLEDGILILNQAGELIHANASAYQICRQFNQGKFPDNCVPSVIWQLCQSLMDSQNRRCDQNITLADEIVLEQSKIFRVRVRLVNFVNSLISGFLVTIENRYESLKNTAILEIKKYELTPREAEIWSLYRSNYSYKDIAAQLYISINTVKKHMKNIHAKRQTFVEVEQ